MGVLYLECGQDGVSVLRIRRLQCSVRSAAKAVQQSAGLRRPQIEMSVGWLARGAASSAAMRHPSHCGHTFVSQMLMHSGEVVSRRSPFLLVEIELTGLRSQQTGRQTGSDHQDGLKCSVSTFAVSPQRSYTSGHGSCTSTIGALSGSPGGRAPRTGCYRRATCCPARKGGRYLNECRGDPAPGL